MGTINIYNSIGNAYHTINGCGKLVDLLPTIDFEHSIVLKAGNRLNSDYEVKPDDLIFVRKIPGATTTIIAGVIVGVGAILAGGAILGAAFEAIYDDKAKEMQQKAQQDAQNLASQINQLPFIKGAQNKSALGQAIPYVMGDVYHTPYKLTDGYYSIEDGDEENGFGTKQYYNVIANFGFGNLQFKEILIGDTSILKNENGIPEGVHDMDETSIFYDSTNKIEICQAGTDFSSSYFGKKVILTKDGSEIKHAYGEAAEPVIRELTEYTKTVEICIQINGLRKYNSEASRWEKRKIKVIPAWTNVENPTESDWNPLYFIGMNNNEIELNTNHTIRFVARKTFTASEVYGKKIKIRLIKETPALESNSNESCYLAYYQSFCYDNKQSTNTNLVDCKSIDTWTNNKTVKVGLRLLANDNTKDLLNEIHAYVCGLARIWNGREWSSNKVPTRNPAAWVYEIMTSDAHIPSKYSDDEFDLESLGQLYEYCENPNNIENPTEKDKLYTDGILTSGIKKIDLVSTILNSCSAVMFKNAEGKMEVRIDKKEDTPVALLNAESISDITFSKDLTRMPDGLKVTFTNRESWQIDTFYIKRDGTPRTQDDTFTELNLNYVTTYEHAYKIALKHLKQMVLQPKELTVDVGRDGDYYPLLSTIMLQYHTFRIGLQSSTITGLIKDNDGNISGIKVSDYIKMETGKNYGVIIQAVSNSGRKCFYKQVAFTHEVRKSLIFNDDIVFSEDILPAIGDTISFGELNENGEFTKIRDVMKITGFTPNGTKGYKLTLKNYNPSIYEAGAIPEYKSNITEPPKPVKEIPAIIDVPEGIKGANGKDGIGITSITQISSTEDGGTNQITVNLSDGSKQSLSTLNGSKGSQGIQGIQGVQGNQGTRAIRYLGKYSSAPSGISGDWYLNTENGYVYYLNGSTWTAITTISDYRLVDCMQDMIELFPTLEAMTTKPAGYNTLKAAIEHYTDCLLTGSLIADKIFSKSITAKNCNILGKITINSGEIVCDSKGNTKFGKEIFIGCGDGVTGINNIAIGSNQNLNSLVSGNFNTAIGSYVLPKVSSGGSNIAIGYANLVKNEKGSNNIVLGVGSVDNASEPMANIVLGNYSLRKIEGTDNIVIGHDSGKSMDIAFNNIVLGTAALNKNTTGSDNISLGKEAGSENTTGYSNTFIGTSAGKNNTTGARNIAIGDSVECPSGTENGQVNIGNKFVHTNTKPQASFSGTLRDLLGIVSSSKATDKNYIKLTNGLIVQWGLRKAGVQYRIIQGIVYFPIAFNSENYFVTVCGNYWTKDESHNSSMRCGNIGTHKLGNTKFKYIVSGDNDVDTLDEVYWFAIGY